MATFLPMPDGRRRRRARRTRGDRLSTESYKTRRNEVVEGEVAEGKNLVDGAEGQNRTADTTIFSRMLYQLSYLGLRNDVREEPKL